MKIVTNYGSIRIEADSWAQATCAIARLQAEEAHHSSLAAYTDELPIDFQNEENNYVNFNA